MRNVSEILAEIDNQREKIIKALEEEMATLQTPKFSFLFGKLLSLDFLKTFVLSGEECEHLWTDCHDPDPNVTMEKGALCLKCGAIK